MMLDAWALESDRANFMGRYNSAGNVWWDFVMYSAGERAVGNHRIDNKTSEDIQQSAVTVWGLTTETYQYAEEMRKAGKVKYIEWEEAPPAK